MSEKIDAILRLLANKQIVSQSLGKMIVYDDDGVTPLYVANVYEDTAGLVPYRANGINRKDKLA